MTPNNEVISKMPTLEIWQIFLKLPENKIGKQRPLLQGKKTFEKLQDWFQVNVIATASIH